MHASNNNDHHNNYAADVRDDIINCILQHEGCMYCKYTPAVLKKELWQAIILNQNLDFQDQISIIADINNFYYPKNP